MDVERKIKVLFVCTGNICRSPMAEAIFKNLIKKENLEAEFHVDSAGTSAFHVGERPHAGTQQVLKKNGVPLDRNLRSQRLNRDQAREYDYLIAMDSGHLRVLSSLGNAHRLLEFASTSGVKDVPDPYYDDNFDQVYDLVLEGSKGLMAYIKEHKDL